MSYSFTITPVPGKLRTKAQPGKPAVSIDTTRGYRAVIIDEKGRHVYTTSVALTESIAERIAVSWIRANSLQAA